MLVGLRLAARLRHGEADEAKERRALKAVAITFFLLAAYVSIEGVRALLEGEEPDRSTVGIVLLTASVIVMPLLARAKRRVGEQLGGDRLIPADAAETKICVLLSISTLAGLVLFSLTGADGSTPSPASSSLPSPSTRAGGPGKASSSRMTMTTGSSHAGPPRTARTAIPNRAHAAGRACGSSSPPPR